MTHAFDGTPTVPVRFTGDVSECLKSVKIGNMDQRDQQLLDKQLWGVSPSPPLNGGVAGVVSFILVVVFLAGLSLGAGFFAHDKQMQFVSYDSPAAIRF